MDRITIRPGNRPPEPRNLKLTVLMSGFGSGVSFDTPGQVLDQQVFLRFFPDDIDRLRLGD